MSYHVLIVDDDPAICKLLSKDLLIKVKSQNKKIR